MPRATGLACAFIDAEGHLADAMADMEAAMVARFDRLAFRIDGATHPRTIEAAMRLAARVQVAERDIEMAGAYRRGAVSDARATGSDVILTGDLDHILRWLRAAPDEVDGALARVRAGEVDCLAVGRPGRSSGRRPPCARPNGWSTWPSPGWPGSRGRRGTCSRRCGCSRPRRPT